MNSGLYAALTGAISATERLDSIANNIANAATTGFKRDRISFESILSGTTASAVNDDPVFVGEAHTIDYSIGPQRQTNNPLDLAIQGDGFFSVRTPQGTAYTRQGSFRVDAVGQLVTPEGHQVLANGAPITIPRTAKTINIDSSGGLSADGAAIARIDLVDFPRPYALEKQGASLYTFQGQNGQILRGTNGRIAQGYLEDSNISTVQEMVQMIATNRHYEACTKVIRGFDDITGKAVNDLGRV